VSSVPGSGGGPADPGGEGAQGIVTAIADVSERASVLVREEIELAKAEMTEKATRLAKGAVVGVAAGIFFVTALWFVLIGLAWLLYYYLPIGSDFTYFWGFFAMALILVILGVIAGLIAAKAVKRGAPPTPEMAIEEARLIRETMAGPVPGSAVPAAGAAANAGPGPGAPGGAPASGVPGAPAPTPGPEAPAVPGGAPYGAAAPAGGSPSGGSPSGGSPSGGPPASVDPEVGS
jgi:Putative Actinobacterial Holin-X, holin superfamily III